LNPPRVVTWLVKRLITAADGDALIGDLREEYIRGRPRAWLWRQALWAVGFALMKYLREGRVLTVRLMLVGPGVSLVCALLLTQSARLLQFWELLYVVGGFTALLLSIQMHTLRRRTTAIDLR
jgi:hypothetical protein